jgi:hypothetical protein
MNAALGGLHSEVAALVLAGVNTQLRDIHDEHAYQASTPRYPKVYLFFWVWCGYKTAL